MPKFHIFQSGTKFILILFIIGFLIFKGCKNQLFYRPQPYEERVGKLFMSDERSVQLSFETSEGIQYAYYLAPSAEKTVVPSHLWIMFCGVNSLALDMYPCFKEFPGDSTGLLMVEYPGYGKNEGVTRARHITENAYSAINSLAGFLNVAPKYLLARLGILGHSLGTGTALNFAVQINPRSLILISAFTTLDDLTRHYYGNVRGTLLSWINPERYDNLANLKKILQKEPCPEIVIIHGSDDDIIPVNMGRRLVQLDPVRIRYVELNGATHSMVIRDNSKLIHKIMKNMF